MLSKCYKIWNISNKGLQNSVGIKIKPMSLLSSAIHPKHQKKWFKGALRDILDFQSLNDL